MTTSPTDRRYSQEHEWIFLEGDTALVGVTDYAQGVLGDVVFLSLPSVGSQVTQFLQMGEVESVKAVSDIYSPVSGEVVDVNQELVDNPQWVNEDPYGKAWMVRVLLSDSSELDNLMTSAAYEAFLGGLRH